MLELDPYKSDIVKICNSLRVKRLDLFGSATGKNFRADSDIDIVVEFERYENGNLFNRYFELKERLQNLFGREIDIVVEKAIKNPHFKESVEKTRTPIFAA